MPRSHINERLHTSFANNGRAAGMGISYDRYDEEGGYRPQPRNTGRVRFPHDGLSDNELAALSGEVRVYKEDKPCG
jgi:hypothetical protein